MACPPAEGEGTKTEVDYASGQSVACERVACGSALEPAGSATLCVSGVDVIERASDMRFHLRGLLALAFLFAVGGAALAQDPAPAEGFWYDPERPGTGFSLERRGALLALTGYDFIGDGGSSRWRLAVAPLSGAEWTATLQEFSGGSCLGCEPYEPIEPETAGSTIQLTFDSARSALLQVDDQPPRRFVTVPFGSPYVAASFAPPDLPLPDLRGRWVYAYPGSNSDARTFTATTMQSEPGLVQFGGSVTAAFDELLIRCEDAASSGPQCRALAVHPTASPPIEIGTFALGDIKPGYMTGTVTGTDLRVVAWRVANAEVQP